MAVTRTDAIVLRKIDYQDTHQIVTLLTRAQGKIGAIARGVRKSSRRFEAGLPPFAVMEIEYAPSKEPSSLSTLRAARLMTVYPRLLQSLPRMQCAGEGLEFARRVLQEHDADVAAFQVVQSFLAALDATDSGGGVDPEGGSDPVVVLRLFEYRLMSVLGFGPRLTSCVSCGRAPGPRQKASYDVQDSSIRCRQCGGASVVLDAVVRERLGSVAHNWSALVSAPWSRAESEQLQQVVRGLRASVAPDRR
jgi:DNA repair protein RecO (recombination protein O)